MMYEPFDSGACRKSRRRILAATAGGLGLSLMPFWSKAQGAPWPSRTIRLIAAQAPGASNDTTARAYADFATRELGTSVVVENKPGGGGMIAAEAVARAPGDGYTLLMILHSNLAQAPALFKKPPLDTTRDLTPIAAFTIGASPMCVRKDLPAANFKELLQLAKTRPVSVGNYAIGSGWQMMMVQLAKQTGAQFTIVTYRGTGPMVQDLMAGNIDVAAGSLTGMNPGIKAGLVRPVLLITSARAAALKGVPTWNDEGFTGPAFDDLIECNMLLGPANLPAPIVARLAALAKDSALRSEPMKNFFALLGVESDYVQTGDELMAFIKRVWPSFQSMTRELGITAS